MRIYTCRKMRPFVYRDCRITIVVNRSRSHPYEWCIEPLKPAIVKRCHGFKSIDDPTSHKFVGVAKMHAKHAVDNILRSNISWSY